MHILPDILNNTPLPWHEAIWINLYQLAQKQKLPSAIFITGMAQAAKSTFVTAFSQLLLCDTPQKASGSSIYKACQQCHACDLFQTNAHAHYHAIQPQSNDPAKASISIEMIRGLTDALTQTRWAHSANHYTIVLIDPADALHIAASNALLKTLEEPMPGIIFMLLSAQPYRVPATIKSRCHYITLPLPSLEKGFLWTSQQLKCKKIAIDASNIQLSLHITGNNPLHSLHVLQENLLDSMYKKIFESFLSLIDPAVNPSDVAQIWSKYPIEIVLNALMQCTVWLIQAKLGHHQLLGQLKISKSYLTLVLEQKNTIALLNYLASIQKLVSEFKLYHLNLLLCLEKLAYDFLYLSE